MKIELTEQVIKQANELYKQLGNIKKVAKLMHISYDRLRNVIISDKITPKKEILLHIDEK